MTFKRHVLVLHGGFRMQCPFCRKQVGNFNKASKEERMEKLLEYSRTGLKIHLATYHTDGSEKPHSIARSVQVNKWNKMVSSLTIIINHGLRTFRSPHINGKF